MKKMFLFSVIGYSVMLLVLNHWPNAVNNTGTAALPWMLLMLVDLAFAGSAFFKIVGPAFFAGDDEDDEISIHAEDVSVPDAWFYGMFAINLIANLGWHAYLFAQLTGVDSTYYSFWFLGEAVGLFLTIVFFRHAQQVARRQAKKAAMERRAGDIKRAA